MSYATDRLSQLRIEIGTELGNGADPESKLAEFRWLWLTTPQMELDNLSYTLRDVEDFVKSRRREHAILAGAGKVKRAKVEYDSPELS